MVPEYTPPPPDSDAPVDPGPDPCTETESPSASSPSSIHTAWTLRYDCSGPDPLFDTTLRPIGPPCADAGGAATAPRARTIAATATPTPQVRSRFALSTST